MTHRSKLPSIGILGGTFDPIHIGHLRAALEIKENLKLDEMRLIPSFKPPHRKLPDTSAAIRLHMARIATADSGLTVDDREITRNDVSYTVDTLRSLRADYPKHSICMTLGLDAFLGLTTWHLWEKIIELANIVVISRASSLEFDTNTVDPKIVDMLEKYSLDSKEDLTEFQHGRIQMQNITKLDISGSRLRVLIARGQSPRFLIPEIVLKYIEKNHLYGYNGVSSFRIDSEVNSKTDEEANNI